MISQHKTYSLGAGFRYSPYGQSVIPASEYWLRVGQEMARRFPPSRPEAIWIVSVVDGEGTHLTFPSDRDIPGISFSHEDENQDALELFDKFGFRVWLQIEPVNVNVEMLFDLILQKYGNHSCVAGVGVDVEWHHSASMPEGEPVDDEEAASWLAAARRYDSQYGLFVKHWKTEMLPPKARDGLLFVDDSQQFESLEHMLEEFSRWGRHFYPSPVAFQIGYPADKPWWSAYPDPAKVIGESILRAVPNTAGLYWVNFSVQDVFPP